MELDAPLDHYTIVQDHRHKTSSCVWKYFGNLRKNEVLVDEKHVYCTKCFHESKTKKYQKSTSTGNLIKHLKKAHNLTDQPSYRIKQEKDRIVVTKEEVTFYDDDVEADYFIDANQSSNYIPLNGGGSSASRLSTPEDDHNEYLVHDINEILIHEIAKRPQIYDASLCVKNKAQIRRDLWTEIYEALNHLIAYEKLPKIWKNIRDRYQKIKKDVDRDSRNGAASATIASGGKPRYRYYDMLRFLDDVECVMPMSDDDQISKHEHQQQQQQQQLSVPIDNFVSNFIFMEDEPEIEQPDSGGGVGVDGGDSVGGVDEHLRHSSSVECQTQLLVGGQQQHHHQLQQQQQHLDEEGVDGDEELDDDDDDDESEDDVTVDCSNLSMVRLRNNVGDGEDDVHEMSTISIKQEIFGNEPKPKKVKLSTTSLASLSESTTRHDQPPAQHEEHHHHQRLASNIAANQSQQQLQQHHRDLMTPDNIASLLVEQHQHEILCHQQNSVNALAANTINSAAVGAAHLPVATWQLTPQLSASIAAAAAAHQQQHHQHQIQIPVSVALTSNANNAGPQQVVSHHQSSAQSASSASASISNTTPLTNNVAQLQTVVIADTSSGITQQRNDTITPTVTKIESLNVGGCSTTTTTKCTSTSQHHHQQQRSATKHSNHNQNNQHHHQPQQQHSTEEFSIFGSYVAEVMRNMDKQKARMLQMKVMQLIAEYDGGCSSSSGGSAVH